MEGSIISDWPHLAISTPNWLDQDNDPTDCARVGWTVVDYHFVPF